MANVLTKFGDDWLSDVDAGLLTYKQTNAGENITPVQLRWRR